MNDLEAFGEKMAEKYANGCVLDFPTAWKFIKETIPEDHDERCSYRLSVGAILCDCLVIKDLRDRISYLAGFKKGLEVGRLEGKQTRCPECHRQFTCSQYGECELHGDHGP